MALAFAVSGAGCSHSVHAEAVLHPDVPHFADTALGDARFSQWLLAQDGRKSRLVDVTGEYPDPQHVVRRAFVLVDAAQHRYRRDDYTHRPIHVTYVSPRAADAATRGHDPHTYGRRGLSVLWVPHGLSAEMTDRYLRAGSVGLG